MSNDVESFLELLDIRGDSFNKIRGYLWESIRLWSCISTLICKLTMHNLPFSKINSKYLGLQNTSW